MVNEAAFTPKALALDDDADETLEEILSDDVDELMLDDDTADEMLFDDSEEAML